MKKQVFTIVVLFLASTLLANVNGVDTQLFKPTTNGLDFITVHSTQTLPPFTFNTGLFVNSSFNSLVPTADKQNYYSDEDILFSSDLNFGYGIIKNLEMGMNAPAVITHYSNPDSPGLYFEENGLLEIAINAKYAIIPRTKRRNFGLAVIPSFNYPLVKDPYFIGVDGNPIFNFEVATDYKYDKVIFGLNMGYRLRFPGEDSQGNLELIDDQMLASAAVSYFDPHYSTGVTFELYGATEVGDTFNSETTPIEALLAFKYNPTFDISIIAGTALGLTVSVGNPDYRFFTGLNYYFGFREKDKSIVKEFEKNINKIKHFRAKPKKKSSMGIKEFKRGDTLKISLPSSLIYFRWNQSNILERATPILSQLADSIKKNHNITQIIIIGHTDSTGKDSYNKALSEKRAKAVKNYMISFGVSKKILKTVGKGESEAIDDNGNFVGRANNRRVEILIK
jgi:outer membrane protein OmpA-like peptidoglycan-associated protein